MDEQRLIDANALMERMYHDAFETDTDMQKWDSGCWIRYKMFENAIDEQPTIEPNLVIVPETIERGCETYIGEDIVVAQQDDFMDMKCKAMLWDAYGEKPKQSEWDIKEVEFGNYKYQCKECGWYENHAYNDVKPYNFCPNCGARMKDEGSRR